MSLFIALIVLVAMTLAGIALVRSIDTTTVISGNLAFRQSTLNATDQGVNAAYLWLMSKVGTSSLNNSDSSAGYYSSKLDPEPDWKDTATWSGLNTATLATDAASNTTTYIIHRMCTQPNTAYNGNNGGVANQCSTAVSTSSGVCPGGSQSIGNYCFDATASGVYYRVTARTIGPRNSTSIVQAMLLIPF
ncbi:pilus assembly PilX family protein [Sulfuricella denitrificans]|nr:hypothetical protein [Sulfuricella denitrificans]